MPTPTPTPNKIKYGLKNVHYAIATIASDGTATYATPVRIPGAVNLSMEAQGERNPFYADDIEYYTSISNEGYEGDLEIAEMPESFEKDVLNEIEDTKKVFFEEINPEPVHFALLFQFAGDQRAIKHVLYNCTAMRPKIEGETKESGITPKTDSLSLRASSIHVASLNKDIVKGKTKSDTDATVDTNWFTTVQLPVISSQ